MKHIKLFESFEIVEPIRYGGEPLNNKEINFLKGYNVMCPEFILKDDNYYYVFDHRCENIKDVPEAYINFICGKYNITNYTINDDFTIDVKGNVYLNQKGFTKIPLKFNVVSENFTCGYNKLTTLEGCPKEVGGHFNCNCNKLTTLEGGPKRVGGHFNCQNNKLTSLEGSPKEVGGNFDCADNQLTTLKGGPEEVGGYFNCSNNKLTSLEGSPKKVGGEFHCYYNQLTTLEGSPKYVGMNFICSHNKLTTLEGGPEYVGVHFACKNNPLTSVKYKGIIKGDLIYN